MTKAVPILAALLTLSACGGAPDPIANSTNQTEAVSGPVIRLAAVPDRPAAGYFTLRISGDRGALLSVRSPKAGRIEMHETMRSGTMTSMRPIARIPVRDGETLVFEPGGRHLMVFDVDRGVAAGERIDLIFHFERGPDQILSAEIVPTGGDVGH